METGIHELTAAYALDALDADERSAYEAHLATCASCQHELESFWRTTEALAVAASGPQPSPALRERILADVRAEPASNVIPFESRRRRLTPVLGAVAAVAAVVALVIGLWAADLSSQLDESQSALDRLRANAAVIADPDSRSVPLQAGSGRLVVGPDGKAVLLLKHLGPAPAGKTYETWVVPGGNLDQAQPAGLFPGGEGAEIVGVDGAVNDGDVVAVTVERHGGVDAPSSAPVVASEPA
jgi:anti-sigma-K factor RskA